MRKVLCVLMVVGVMPLGTLAGGCGGSGGDNTATPQTTPPTTPPTTGGFSSPPNDPMFGDQWHLENTGQNGATPGEDARVRLCWSQQNVDGTGVRIAVYDDGVEVGHEDMMQNAYPAGSTEHRDFADADNDPSPVAAADNHGHACAGVAAGRGHNSVGTTGAAPRARVAGIRMNLGAATDAIEAMGMTHNVADTHIYSMSVGAPDNGMVWPTSVEEWNATETGVTTGRGGRGSLYSKAAGNGGQPTPSSGANDDHSNLEELNSHRGMINVGAVNAAGTRSNYSERGANLLICAPSNQTSPGNTLPGITTTDRTGAMGYDPTNYTASFGGTSSATPLVSGVMALMLHARPELNFRDVREILATTARQTEAGPLWLTNGAGLTWSHHYGFGVIDANAAVAAAKTWTLLPADQAPVSSGALPIGTPMHTFVATGRTEVEHVIVTIAINTTDMRSLRWKLTSPAGTTVNLTEADSVITAPFNGTIRFGATAFMNEVVDGTWTLGVDVLFGGTHTSSGWQIEVWAH